LNKTKLSGRVDESHAMTMSNRSQIGLEYGMFLGTEDPVG